MQTLERAGMQVTCRSCGTGVTGNEPFCASCGKVQPPREGDYFEFFGLPRKLNLDLPALEKQFYRFSRKLHPDVYARASEEEQQWSLAQASLLNDAYRTLKNAVERTKYLLQLEGVQFEDDHPQGKEAGNSAKSRAKAPADLLEEVFELNMQLEELQMNKKMGEDDPELRSGLERSRDQFVEQLNSVDEELRGLWMTWDNSIDANDETRKSATREEMTTLLQRRSYLENLVRDVNETLAES
jgi:molecular chaperone HscB